LKCDEDKYENQTRTKISRAMITAEYKGEYVGFCSKSLKKCVRIGNPLYLCPWNNISKIY
jgi:hypothetical protein